MARTQSKAEAAIADIQSKVPDAPIKFLHLDLASLSSVAAAAKTFTASCDRLDLLINNAGVMAVPKGTTADGYEIQFGTNYIGHFLLTKLLLPTLLSTAATQPSRSVRIVSLTSEGHKLAPRGKLDVSHAALMALGPWPAYGQSKLANILFTRELARRQPEIASVAVHPGVIKTDLYLPNSKANPLIRFGVSAFGWLFTDVPTGAKGQLWAATCKGEGLQSGGYYTPIGALSSGSGPSSNEESARQLWKWTEKELEGKGY